MTSADGVEEPMVTSAIDGTWSPITALAPPSKAAPAQGGQWSAASIAATACSSATQCIAAGTVTVAPSQLSVFVATWTNGTWSNAAVLGGLPSSTSITVSATTCSDGGACAVGGTYAQGSTKGIYVAAGSGGVFGTALATDRVSGGSVGGSLVLTGLACGGASTCVASGTFVDSAIAVEPFAAVASAGEWSPLERLPGVDLLNVGSTRYNNGGAVSAIECFDDGSCVAVGTAMDAGGTAHIFSATLADGNWDPAVAIPEVDGIAPQGANPVALQCASVSSCDLLVATYSALGQEGVAVATMEGGTWGAVTEVAGVTDSAVGSDGAVPEGLSCSAPDTCTAIMVATDADSTATLLAASLSGPDPLVAVPLDLSPGVDPSLYALGISCATIGECAVVALPPFPSLGRGSIVEERNGVWQAAARTTGLAAVLRAPGQVMGTPQLVTCATPTSCVVAGQILDSSGTLQGFVATVDDGTASGATILAHSAGVNAGANLTSGFSATSLACPQPSQCILAGTTTSRSGQPVAALAVQLPTGWSTLQAPAGLSVGWSSVADGVSCGSPSACMALVTMTGPSGQVRLGTVRVQGGVIGSIRLLAADPNPSVLVQHVEVVAWQCSGNRCIGAGTWDRTTAASTSFGMTVNGTKAATQAVMGTTNFSVRSVATAMACSAPQRCVIAGTYQDVAGLTQGFVIGYANGTWGAAQPVPGIQALNSGAHGTVGASIDALACPSAGRCIVLGTAVDRFGRRQVVIDRSGNSGWGRAQIIPGTIQDNSGGQAQVLGLSCAQASTCAGLVTLADHGVTVAAVIPLTTSATQAPVVMVTPADAGTVVVSSASTVLCRPHGACTVLVTTRSASGATEGALADLQGATLGNGRFLSPADPQAASAIATATSALGGVIVGSMATLSGVVPWAAGL